MTNRETGTTPDILRRPTTSLLALAVAAVALHGCSSEPERQTAIQVTPTGGPYANPEDGTPPLLIFDDLGGGANTIHTYPGTTEAAADKIPIATYYDGADFYVDCQTDGRVVTSDQTAGEAGRSTTIWFKLSIDETLPQQYATGTYTENFNQLVQTLPECE